MRLRTSCQFISSILTSRFLIYIYIYRFLFDFTFYQCLDPDNRTIPITQDDDWVLAFNIWPERILNEPEPPAPSMPVNVPSSAAPKSPAKGKVREEGPKHDLENITNRPAPRDPRTGPGQKAGKPGDLPERSSLPTRPGGSRGGYSRPGHRTPARGALGRGLGIGHGARHGQGAAEDEETQKENTRPPWRR